MNFRIADTFTDSLVKLTGEGDAERYLLYVVCIRVRDYLLVSSVDPESEFLDDLNG